MPAGYIRPAKTPFDHGGIRIPKICFALRGGAPCLRPSVTIFVARTLPQPAYATLCCPRLSVRSALHLKDTAIQDGRTSFGAPHVKPKSGRSFPQNHPAIAPAAMGATKLYRRGHCLTPCAPHICTDRARQLRLGRGDPAA